MKRKVIIRCCIIAGVLALIAGGKIMFDHFFGTFAGIEKEDLVGYQYTVDGDMLGSSYSESVRKYGDEEAIITILKSEWHGDDGTVKEYLTDKAILDELKAVFVKYRMKNWDNKKFTNMFIADGASYGYRFSFENNSVHFSSQHYPEKYASKLSELREIFNQYTKDAVILPGLVISGNPEESDSRPDLNGGEITLSVCSYYQTSLYYRLTNGTDEDMEGEYIIRLYKDGENVPMFEKNVKYRTTFAAHASDDDFIELKERLAPGKYRLEVFGYTTEFEIR